MRKGRTDRQKLIAKLDRLWATKDKENAECEVCLTIETPVNYTQLHPHHIIGRGWKNLRFDLKNRLWVCPSHHTLGRKCVEYNQEGWFWSNDSDNDWISENKPGIKEYLKERKVIKNWKVWELEELIKELS